MVESLPPLLPESVLQKRLALPVKPDSVTLTGKLVKLVPLDVARDSESLFNASNGSAISIGNKHTSDYNSEEVIWKYYPDGPFEKVEEFSAYLSKISSPSHTLVFTIFDYVSDKPIGIIALYNNNPKFLKVEFANVWVSPVISGNAPIVESFYLLLKHLFQLGYLRVEWKLNSLDQKHRDIAVATGFYLEGIQRYHMIIKDRNQDTAWYRIIDTEWNAVETRLSERFENN